MHDQSHLTPDPVAGFLAGLHAAIPGVSVGIDRPTDPSGEWWLEVGCEDFKSSVAWRSDRGFGVFTSEPGYADRPDEVYRSPELAAQRVQQLVRHWQESSKLQPLSLSDIRQLCDTRQTTVADALSINQGAVSRLERRQDMKLSSLHSYFRALGGRLELRVFFDSFEAAVAAPCDDETDP